MGNKTVKRTEDVELLLQKNVAEWLLKAIGGHGEDRMTSGASLCVSKILQDPYQGPQGAVRDI